ncbi:unnamed protein product [Leptidea sinapis]|uniref:U1-type domain-containing protein n=1 Tax=Leptidea sinapis TaxID=189913 RepID=A0A5E4PYR3_9NEOP|nr:unnamed protein product [Leptidea sinapis]
MSRDIRYHPRSNYRPDPYRHQHLPPARKRSRSPVREIIQRSRSPRIHDKNNVIDDNILSEISKLPEPSELWDNQIQPEDYDALPPNFQMDGSAYQNFQPSYPGGYNDFSSAPPVVVPDVSSWNQMSLPPPPIPQVLSVEDQIKKEAAIESEMRHQKAALSKQREDYLKKTAVLKKELDTLKDQRNELRGDPKRSPSPDTKRFLKENTKLQLEIQNKLKTISNVVDMLNGIIGEEAAVLPEVDDSVSERTSKRKSRSPANKKFNYVYYDPEMHWCRVCNEFPPTAKDYLNHLHSPSHHKNAAAHMEAPWHSVTGANEGFPNYPSAPTKRTPIKGLQFFVPSTAWYCKLCDQFIGDLHCASAHLKSLVHARNYSNFVEQNPHWETDWMSDRQKSFEKARANKKEKVQYTAHTITFSKDGFHTSRKTPSREEDEGKKKDKKKKKKRNSSSSSSRSSSSSTTSEPQKKKKKSKKEKVKNDVEEQRIKEWMSSVHADRFTEADRKLLENLKSRMKREEAEEVADESRRERERPVKRHQVEPRRGSRTRDERPRSFVDSRRRDVRRDERRDVRRDERRDDRRDDQREDQRDGGRSDRREERRDERRDTRRDSSPPSDVKKPEIRKMPFIGKMPVFKLMGKGKSEEQKKEEEKKKEEEELQKKKRETDAEIQKKVAEFKEKIARSQLERQQNEQQQQLMTSALLPAAFLVQPPATVPAPAAPPAPPGTQPPPVNLPKDFQDALDIIFPTDVKPDMNHQQEMFPGLAFPGLGLFPQVPQVAQVPQVPQMAQVPQVPQMSILGQPPFLTGFDLNHPLFPHHLYDSRNMGNNSSGNNNNSHNNKRNKKQNNKPAPANNMETKNKKIKAEEDKKKEEMDDLALLGIDASDVGSGM